MIFHSVPKLIQYLYPSRIWRKNDSEEEIFLTFDDGPVRGVTEFVLNELEKRAMKATFFMVGANVLKNPELAKEVAARGHGIGNHTQHHLNGWKTPLEDYLNDFKKCDHVLEEVLGFEPRLFRPPYGKMTGGQAKIIQKSHELIMWNVLTGDYDQDLPAHQLVSKTVKWMAPGAIVVLHDQEKTKSVMKKILPEILDFITDSGYQTAVL